MRFEVPLEAIAILATNHKEMGHMIRSEVFRAFDVAAAREAARGQTVSRRSMRSRAVFHNRNPRRATDRDNRLAIGKSAVK